MKQWSDHYLAEFMRRRIRDEIAKDSSAQYDPSLSDSARSRLLEVRTESAEARVVARLIGSHGMTIFEDRLAAIRVSSTPMMTYRLLGFGGRMFAVPFVRPRTGWVNIDPADGVTIP
jgi:hypothetical protein